MNRKYCFFIMMGICISFSPLLLVAQSPKLLRPASDTALVTLSKKEVQQLDAVPVTASRLILTGSANGSKKEVSLLWLARKWQKKVTEVDGTLVISKYIGETEKNLDMVFKGIDAPHYILLINDADALFGKGTPVKDAHDKYANQEMSSFMKRLEKYEGIVALSLNNNKNVDSVFLRRFYLVKVE